MTRQQTRSSRILVGCLLGVFLIAGFFEALFTASFSLALLFRLLRFLFSIRLEGKLDFFLATAVPLEIFVVCAVLSIRRFRVGNVGAAFNFACIPVVAGAMLCVVFVVHTASLQHH